MGIGTAARNYLVLSRVEEREHQRKVVESWFLTLPGISESDKKMMERSQKYNLGVSMVRFIVLEMLFLCLFAFCYYQFDPYESTTGYRLTGKKTTIAVVQEDGISASFKDPNVGEHVTYKLADLGVNPDDYSYQDRITIFWEKENSGYKRIIAISEQQNRQIENFSFRIIAFGMSAILLGGVMILLVRRRIYTDWYTNFYWRMEKFCSLYGVYTAYPGLETPEAFVAYGTSHPTHFAEKFENVFLTEEDLRQKRKSSLVAMVVSVLIIVAIFGVAVLVTSVSYDSQQEETHMVERSIAERFVQAANGEIEPLGESSELYNYGDMVAQIRTNFPGEDVYYKITVKDDYLYVATTTSAKKNVYLERYLPVDGTIGDDGISYRLDISMISDATQPDDILNHYTGVVIQ